MWREPQNEGNDILEVICSKCSELCENVGVPSPVFIRKCQICKNIKRLFKCKRITCESYVSVCPDCDAKYFNRESKKTGGLYQGYNSIIDSSKSYSCLSPIFAGGIIMMIMATYFYYNFTGNSGNENKTIIEKLRRDYPLQKNETWYHFLSILENEVPSVKAITFLHGKDKETCDCLAKELILLYTKNKNLKSEDITFSDFDVDDYGFVLQHYQTVVQKFGVFLTDLNKVPGNLARIFHWLCDEVSSSIKPSLFVFTVKCDDESTKILKPVERATSILRKAWSDLPENELSPLLSRVVKNVVDVVPENRINC